MEILAIILEAIPTLGFPIVCVLAMGIFIYRIYKDSGVREKALMAEITENRIINAEAIKTISKYADSLDNIKSDISDIKNDITVITTKIQ